MLARYTIYRRRPAGAPPLPDGVRQDTRFRTNHVLRPDHEAVEKFLADPSDAGWKAFKEAYLKSVSQRFADDRQPFEQLAHLATEQDVYLGCSCPTKKNPEVRHCHTYLALKFMKSKFPKLKVELPPPTT